VWFALLQLFHDRGRLTTSDEMDGTRRLRCLFYALSVLAESESTRNNGVVIVSVFGKNTRKAALDKSASSRGLKLVRSEAFPARVVAGHLVVMEDRPLLTAFASLVVGLAETLHVLRGKIFVHNHGKSTSGSILTRLHEYGFEVEGIPTVPLRGLFSLGCFKAWVEDRLRREVSGDARASAGARVTSLSSDAATDAVRTQRGGEDATDEEGMARKKKRIDAAYCRRKRFKKKIELEVTQAEAERLRQQNERLRDDGATLERCLHEARTLVERYENGESESELNVPSQRSQMYRGTLPEGEFGRAPFRRSSDRPGAACSHEARIPSDSAAKRATSEIARSQLLHASHHGVNDRPMMLPTCDQVSAPPNLSYSAIANLSHFGYPVTSASQGASALGTLRFGDLVSDALLQQQAYRARLLAAVDNANPLQNPFASAAASQSAASAELRRRRQNSRNPIDFTELEQLELCGQLKGPYPPRFS
jgi:hypothetical protein